MKHDSASLQQIEESFHRVASLSSPERIAMLDTLGADLAAEVQALLDADAALQRALPAEPLQSGPHRDEAASFPLEGSLQGTLAGRYRLLHPIGQGGMGVVYLAEREDEPAGSPAKYRAAIKFLRGALPSYVATASFLQERDALARLSHAAIARLLDAGTTADGRFYVAMEYIEGRRIDEFADDPRTTAQDLLPVLEELCEAVAEAHRNLILHRDIKPSNVLVTTENHAKLLDFGTRQLLDRTGAATGGGAHALTPRYASPEQLEARTLSTASDVYSLGLTLHRALAGSLPPTPRQQVTASRSAQEAHANLLPLPLRGPRVQRLRLSRQLARDLNAIVLRATRHAHDERYRSVAALLQDLRSAKAGARVRARGDGWSYRTFHFVRSHRSDFIVGILVVLLLFAGVLLSLRQQRRAFMLQQRTFAGVHAEQQLAHFLLFDYFDQLQNQPGSIAAQRMAATEALHSLDELEQHSSDAALRIDAVEGYTRLGKLLGSSYEQNLGDVPAATATLRRAVQLAQQLRAGGANTLPVSEAEESARTGMAQVLVGEGKFKEIPEWIDPGVRTARAVAADPASSATSLLRAALTLNVFGDLYGQESDMTLHDGPRSIAIYQEAEAAYAQGVRRDPNCADCRSGMAVESWKLGMLHRQTDSNIAAMYYRQSLQAIESLPPDELSKALARRRHIFIRQRLAEVEQIFGNLPLALQLDEAARADSRDIIAHSPQDLRVRRDLADVDSQLSTMEIAAHRPQQGVEIAREYVSLEEEIAQLSPHSSMWQQLRFDAEDILSQALFAAGDSVGAKSMQARAVADAVHFAEMPGASDSVLILAATILSRRHVFPDKAVAYAERNMKDSSEPAGDDLLELARAETQAGNRDRARAAIVAAHAFFLRYPRAPNHDASERELRQLQASPLPPR